MLRIYIFIGKHLNIKFSLHLYTSSFLISFHRLLSNIDKEILETKNSTERLTVKNRKKHLNHPFAKKKTNGPPKRTQDPKIFMWGMEIYHPYYLPD